jgi:hypothetical protein
VFKYLESRDIDEVGYTLRTASLMTNPEYFFNDQDPSDYRLFGIRYLIVPSGYYPPVPAQPLIHAGAYSLWTLARGAYIQVGSIVGELGADRTNVGLRSIPILGSPLAQDGEYLRVTYGHTDTRSNTLAAARPIPPPPGSRLSQHDDLREGEADSSVSMNRPGVVVLSASYDPGWTATVDGHPARPTMVAPALVAAPVSAGIHRIVFRYRGYPGYPALFALAAATLLALAGGAKVRRRLRKRWP